MLWTLVLLSLLVSAMAASGSGRTRQAADLRRNAQLRAEADGGVDEALFHLLDGSRAHWAADGAWHRERLGATTLAMRIDNESGKVNPNRVSLELLVALLQGVGADRRQAAAIGAGIVAWRFPSRITAGYGGAGHDYLPPDAPFETLPELGLVLGMTPQLLAALEPHLSLYRDGDPDPAAADPVVRRAMQALTGAGDAGGGGTGAGDPGALATMAAGQNSRDESLVAVTVEARDMAGHRFRRRAVIRTRPAANPASSPGARPYEALRWE